MCIVNVDVSFFEDLMVDEADFQMYVEIFLRRFDGR